MGMYDLETDAKLEKDGVPIDYSLGFRVTVARSGGANVAYQRQLEFHSRKYKRAIDLEALDNEVALSMLKDVYASAIVKKWEVETPDGETIEVGCNKWREGIETRDGIVPWTSKLVREAFDQINDVFLAIREDSERQALYRVKVMEDEAKNS